MRSIYETILARLSKLTERFFGTNATKIFCSEKSQESKDLS